MHRQNTWCLIYKYRVNIAPRYYCCRVVILNLGCTNIPGSLKHHWLLCPTQINGI